MKNDATRQWLVRIAKAVGDWPTMPKDSVEVAMAVSTPFGAMVYIANTIPDAGERAAVKAALPTITTDDFAAAARQIRKAAEVLA
jgi:hypothetical protein